MYLKTVARPFQYLPHDSNYTLLTDLISVINRTIETCSTGLCDLLIFRVLG